MAFCCLSLYSCKEKEKNVETPWGTTVPTDGEESEEEAVSLGDRMTLEEIQQGGEMIMLTMSGPDTYYDYHGRGMGVQYLLAEKLAEHLGVTLRVDLCTDTLDMLQRLRNGEADIIVFSVSKEQQKGFIACGMQDEKSGGGWIVSKSSKELAAAVSKWYKPSMYDEAKSQNTKLLSAPKVTRHVYPSMLSAKTGVISNYDALFRKYAPTAGLDWILLAAQCYQESCFDPKAHSWAGACGLMQLMPGTADQMGVSRQQIYEPEANVSGAARYMRLMMAEFSDVGNPQERIKFALAAYNGGARHVRDAMALTKKNGGIDQHWNDVRHYILALQKPEFYRDPVVKNGYMRGSETAGYVDNIMQRWSQYRQAIRTGGKIVSTVKNTTPTTSSQPVSASILDATPHRASKANKWRKEEVKSNK